MLCDGVVVLAVAEVAGDVVDGTLLLDELNCDVSCPDVPGVVAWAEDWLLAEPMFAEFDPEAELPDPEVGACACRLSAATKMADVPQAMSFVALIICPSIEV